MAVAARNGEILSTWGGATGWDLVGLVPRGVVLRPKLAEPSPRQVMPQPRSLFDGPCSGPAAGVIMYVVDELHRSFPIASVQAVNDTSTAHAAINPSATPVAMRYARHISFSVSGGLAKLRETRRGG